MLFSLLPHDLMSSALNEDDFANGTADLVIDLTYLLHHMDFDYKTIDLLMPCERSPSPIVGWITHRF